MNQSIINQLPDTLLPTGERAECTNGYGVYDMVGNLHEWVDDPDGTFRGGYYMDTTQERRRLLVPHHRARLHLPRLLDGLPLLHGSGAGRVAAAP